MFGGKGADKGIPQLSLGQFNSSLLNIAIEIVSFPIQNGDVP